MFSKWYIKSVMEKSKCISLYWNIFLKKLFLINALLLEKYIMREKQSLEQVVKKTHPKTKARILL